MGIKTRIERNKEIITEVYEYIKEKIIGKDLKRHLKVFIVREDFIIPKLLFSWSWFDLESLINLISKEIPREEFDEKCSDSAYGSWCLGDVVHFLANLIVDYPHIIEELYIKRTNEE